MLALLFVIYAATSSGVFKTRTGDGGQGFTRSRGPRRRAEGDCPLLLGSAVITPATPAYGGLIDRVYPCRAKRGRRCSVRLRASVAPCKTVSPSSQLLEARRFQYSHAAGFGAVAGPCGSPR